MTTQVPPDAPKARLAHLKKWPHFNGYGFNLHAEKGKAGQFIGKVDQGSPADLAGLKAGDRIIEVNGTNIANENHQQVVTRIKAVPNETKMLVVDAEADAYYKDKKIVIRGDMPNVMVSVSPDQEPSTISNQQQSNGVPESSGSEPRPRHCHLKIWPEFQGFGFNLHAEKGKPGQFIGKVDDDSPADKAGLKQGDRIVEVNGDPIGGVNHKEVVEKIKQHPDEVSLLVVDPDTDSYYKDKGVSIHGGMSQVETIICPDSRPSSQAEVVTASVVATVESTPPPSIDSDPHPRLCHLKIWEDFQGYGFNLHAEKGKPGQFIGSIDNNSPAQLAGLQEGDKIVEVNGSNVSQMSHGEVVQKIKSNPSTVKMLVIDKPGEEYYKEKGVVISSEMSNVETFVCPDRRPDSSEVSGIDNSIPRPRLSHLKRWTDFQGYGFNLQAEKGKPGQFIGKVDPGSPAESAGLRSGDRIVEVNGSPVRNATHSEVVQKIKTNPDWVKMLVVTKDEELYYDQKNLPLNGSLSNIDVIVCPDQNPAQQNGTVQAEVTPVQVNHVTVEENGIVSEQVEEVQAYSTSVSESRVERQPSPEPEPEPIREPSPEPIREPSPEPVREATPEPVREATPEPVREATPEPVREPSPEPIREPSPEPVRAPTPEPVREPTPEPVREPTPPPREPTPEPEEPKKPEPTPVAAPAATKPEEPKPAPASSGSLLEFSGSAKEARERMMGKRKKADPRQSSLNMREKYELFQKL